MFLLYLAGSLCNETTLHIVYIIVILLLLITILILIVVQWRLRSASGKSPNLLNVAYSNFPGIFRSDVILLLFLKLLEFK